jgi:hypothetical protein
MYVYTVDGLSIKGPIFGTNKEGYQEDGGGSTYILEEDIFRNTIQCYQLISVANPIQSYIFFKWHYEMR